MTAEKKVKRKLSKVNEPLKIEGQGDVEKKPSENSYFAVYDLEFSEPTAKEREAAQKKAEKDKRIVDKEEIEKLTLTISGNEFAIALQASLLDAMRDLIRYELKKIGESRAGDRNSDVRMLSKHPKVYLYFQEDRAGNVRPREGEISFRLMNQTNDSISIADLKKLAAKIKEIFGGTTDYIWNKGRRYATYNHWELGYKLQLLSSSIKEGEKLIQDILKIQGHEFKKSRMTYSQNQAEAEAFPAKPSKQRVLGEEINLPARRPVCKVKFRYAYLEVSALNKEIVLFSLNTNKPVDFRLRAKNS